MRIVGLLGLVAALVACSPAPSSQTERTGNSANPTPQRTLNVALRTEVNVLMPKIPGSTNPSVTTRIFNAEPAIIDE